VGGTRYTNSRRPGCVPWLTRGASGPSGITDHLLGDVVIHIASKPHIARAAIEPDVAFWQGTALTHGGAHHQRQSHPLRRRSAPTTGGDRGWKGGVPIVQLDTRRIQSIGWCCHLSTRETLRQSVLAMIPDLR